MMMTIEQNISDLEHIINSGIFKPSCFDLICREAIKNLITQQAEIVKLKQCAKLSARFYSGIIEQVQSISNSDYTAMDELSMILAELKESGSI